jgi:hypothetical protein
MAIFKRQTAGPYPVTAPEQVITYQIVLTNDGDRPLSNIVPTEIYPGNGAGTLSPPTESISNNNILNVGESWTYTATYTVTAADITAGTDLVNTISVVTDWIPAPTIFKATTPVAGTASLTSRNVNLTSSRAADVNPVLQGEFGLKAYPNPFTDNVYFDLQLKTDSKVRLEIFNIDGTKLSTIYDDCVVAFNHYELEYKPKNFSSGMLIYRLIVDGKLMFTGKLIHK